MTQKQIRDIAAYYGCQISYRNNADYSYGPMELNWDTLECIDNPYVSHVKLHLRPISKLTDDERKNCELIHGLGPLFGDNGQGLVLTEIDGRYVPTIYTNPKLVSYLQSIGVYVPGTIDEDFVQLT